MAKKKPMFRSPMMTSKAALERSATIRRQNVQRHQVAAAKNKLRDDIARDTANRNYQFELGRLQEASLRHNGLDVAGLNRMNALKGMVR